MAFDDSNAGYEVSIGADLDPTYRSGMVKGLELGDFLSRPTLIRTIDWLPGISEAPETFNPWNSFFTHPAIREKVQSYGLLQARLCVKFVVSSTPFQYGSMLVSYNPLPAFSLDSPIVIQVDPPSAVQHSQRPHLWLEPSSSMGGTMCLPFMYHENWLPNKTAKLSSMGSLTLEPIAPLRSVGTVSRVEIQVYAWAEDVHLTAPTFQLQGGKKKKKPAVMDRVKAFSSAEDEYGTGPISGVAAAVAKAAGQLTSVPIIGPYALATQMVSGATSRIARFFGFSQLPMIENVSPIRSETNPGFASSECVGGASVLTYDPKSELTVDSRTVGLDGSDEMAMSYLLQRESYVFSFEWDSSQSPGTTLKTLSVTPQYFRDASGYVQMTPACHASSAFQNWRGDLIFRFRVICTKYHGGRLHFSWDPRSSNFTPSSGLDTTKIITRVVDIQDDQDIEMRVPWMAARQWLDCHELEVAPLPYGDINIGNSNLTYVNGMLYVKVHNSLTAPEDTAPVRILVSVRGAENLELANPRFPQNDLRFSLQSGVEHVEASDLAAPIPDHAVPMKESVDDDNAVHVFFADPVTSIRQLLSRKSYVTSVNGQVSGYSLVNVLNQNEPAAPGPSSNGTYVVDGTNYNIASFTAFSWFAPLYKGFRGSTTWDVILSQQANDGWMSAQREPGNPTSTILDIASYSLTGGDTSRLELARFRQLTANGAALVARPTQSSLIYQVPFQSPYRFHPTSETYRRNVFAEYDSHSISYTTDLNVLADLYASHGPDMSFFYFSGVPAMVRDSQIPDPTPP